MQSYLINVLYVYILKTISIMKKLNGMKNFSSLENKKLNDLSKITGGLMAETSKQWTYETGSGSDTGVYVDNKLVAVITEPA